MAPADDPFKTTERFHNNLKTLGVSIKKNVISI